MKNIIGIMSVILLYGLTSLTMEEPKVKTIKFMTTAVCGECKDRIEEKLNYTKGVIYSELDLETKMLTVKFKTEVISEQQIKEVLASIGYSSDTVIRDPEAYKALPKCCQSSGHCEPGK